MIDAEAKLQALALAANQHAQEQHGQIVCIEDAEAVDQVDQILDRERSAANAELAQPLVLCYGSWWGEWVRQHIGAQWSGLSEPTPPRIEVNGLLYSPMDAVRRRLTNDSAPTLRSLSDGLLARRGSERDDENTINRNAWDSKVSDPRFTFAGSLPGSRDEALGAIDPWLAAEGDMAGRSVLCLAAGGGTHGPLHALAGADVTVVDLSPGQIEIDQHIAAELGLPIRTIVTAMEDLTMLSDGQFDAVIHPVSLCYVRDVQPVYGEIARVLRSGGLYISQQKQPGSLQASIAAVESRYLIESPADDGHALPAATEDSALRESGTIEFVHPLGTLLGSLCGSGFVIEEMAEPPRGDAWAPLGSPEHRARYLPPYLKIKARRR